jgi:hypothetical protein
MNQHLLVKIPEQLKDSELIKGSLGFPGNALRRWIDIAIVSGLTSAA